MFLNTEEYKSMTADAVGYARIIETQDKQLSTRLFAEFHDAHKHLTDCLSTFDEAKQMYYSTNKLRYIKRRKWEQKMRTADTEFALHRDAVYACLKKMEDVAHTIRTTQEQ